MKTNGDTPAAGPLASLKVLDFSTLLPGPCATMMLADMGAEVLRVESPNRPDLLRLMPPMTGKVSAGHAYLNRSKRSLSLDLKQPGAVEIVQELIQRYDILVEQFRPGVMERLGLGYEALRALNPRLIYCSITGYGQTGPYKDRAGHDINYLALSGIAAYSGRKSSGPPPLGIQVADVAGGSHHAVMGILAAVIQRQQTGQGQHVDVSMTDAAFAMNHLAAAAYLGGGVATEPEGMMLNGGAFYDYYRTQDGGYLSVGSLEPQFMKVLCEVIGRPDLASKGISPNPAHQAEIRQVLTEAIASRTLAEWRDIFAGLDACVEPVLSLAQAAEHPQLQAREMVVEVADQDGQTQRQLGCPIKFSATPSRPRYAGVPLGAHSQEVLAELGYSQDQIQALKARKVIG